MALKDWKKDRRTEEYPSWEHKTEPNDVTVYQGDRTGQYSVNTNIGNRFFLLGENLSRKSAIKKALDYMRKH